MSWDYSMDDFCDEYAPRYPKREPRSWQEEKSANAISPAKVTDGKAKLTIDIRDTEFIDCGKKIGTTGCFMYVQLKVRNLNSITQKPQVAVGKNFENSIFDSYCWKEIKSSTNKGYKLEFTVDLYRNQGRTEKGKIRIVTTGEHFIPLRGSHCEIKITVVKDPGSSYDQPSRATEEVYQEEPQVQVELIPVPPSPAYPSAPHQPYKKTAEMSSSYSNGTHPSTFGELVSSLKSRGLGPESLCTASSILRCGMCLVCNLSLGNSAAYCHNQHATGSQHCAKARALQGSWDNFAPALNHKQRAAEKQRRQRELDLKYVQELREYEEAVRTRNVRLQKYEEEKQVRDAEVTNITQLNQLKLVEAFLEWEKVMEERPEIQRIPVPVPSPATAETAGIETRGKRDRDSVDATEAPVTPLPTQQQSQTQNPSSPLQPCGTRIVNAPAQISSAAAAKLQKVDFKAMASGEVAISGFGTFAIKGSIMQVFQYSWKPAMKAWVVSRKPSDSPVSGPLTVAEAKLTLARVL